MLFFVFKIVNYVLYELVVLVCEIVEIGEIMIFVGKDFVVIVCYGEYGGLFEVCKWMDVDFEYLWLGLYVVMYVIVDYVVDYYFEVINFMEIDIDSIEEVVFVLGCKFDIELIYLFKWEVVELCWCVNLLLIVF